MSRDGVDDYRTDDIDGDNPDTFLLWCFEDGVVAWSPTLVDVLGDDARWEALRREMLRAVRDLGGSIDRSAGGDGEARERGGARGVGRDGDGSEERSGDTGTFGDGGGDPTVDQLLSTSALHAVRGGNLLDYIEPGGEDVT